ncbi:hypothetical protein LOD99_11860 [Oopsacas minuta]|uniref:Basic leucine zipper domain-containing protein n=1 Tax=Oopsacas minuta TaxID=111878 RepID=A0AAV7JM30_9METZ|nr:hypothetical protein LOD99_11860 [Oopsacas minuta]
MTSIYDNEISVKDLAGMRTKEINKLFKETNVTKEDASKLRYQRRRLKIKEYSKIHHQRVKDMLETLEKEKDTLEAEYMSLQAEVTYLKGLKWYYEHK